nr:hypothetical protein [Gryllus firmus]WPO06775.1 hypothetical protein [Gryllus firmus]WPO06777.1 hypothetical protein [Gryllus firmus]
MVMALHCIVRNFPKYAQLSSKCFSGYTLTRTASVLGPLRLHNSKVDPWAASSNTALNLSPTYLNKIDLSQVKAFSVTSSKLSAAGHDHTKLWSAERILSAALLGIAPAAFLYPSAALDTLLAVTFVMHNHWGIEAIVVDYVRPIIFGNAIPKIALGLTYGFSIAMLVGLFYLIFNGSGLVNTIQHFWKI